jgi:hypothetical protein
MTTRMSTTLGLALLSAMLVSTAPATSPSSDALAFFETRVRPVLAENCYPCHGPQKQRSGLRLDQFDSLLKGGDRGPALVPREPEKSLLIRAIRYTDEDLRMPPKSKLTEGQIQDLTTWVNMGAPVPRPANTIASETAQLKQDFDLAQRRRHWAYQPVRWGFQPAVRNKTWCTSPVDAFILAQLKAAGLAPAPPADRRTLIRRLTFDLLGLPPTPAEVEAFVADTAPDAWDKLVERLLASPHSGERWARHWLDLVRFAQTLGHEFDYELPNAWRYRDYVIRAFNSDVPYSQFVVEHLAGDLLPHPRRHPTGGYNESIIGTGFFWLGEGKHSPVDIRQEQADRIDNQLDVLGKALLAQTIACARCHDHKFDAIATKDYYALAGYLKSSRYQQAFIDPPERIAARAEQLGALKTPIRAALLASWAEQADRTAAYLLAAQRVLQATPKENPSVAELATAAGLEVSRLERWVKALRREDLHTPQHPLYAWAELAKETAPAKPFASQRQALLASLQRKQDQARGTEDSMWFADFRQPDYSGWFVTGNAFGQSPSRTGDLLLRTDSERSLVLFVGGGWAHSGLLSQRLEGVLRSRTFALEKRYIQYRAAGRGGQINLVIDGFPLNRDPIYGGLTLELKDERPAWRVMDVGMWHGHRAYIEILDNTTPLLTRPFSSEAENGQPGNGYILVDAIRFTDEKSPPLAAPNPVNLHLLTDPAGTSLAALARGYQELVAGTIAAGQPDSEAAVEWLNWLLQAGLLDCEPPPGGALAQLLEQHRRLEASIPAPRQAVALADGTGEDEWVFLRGNYKTPGERAPRRLPEVLAGAQPPPQDGSGRLDLARRLVDPSNPLLTRVLVNRLWQHHFGEGLVRTPDDFGHMGERPTHPELLDYLATEFVRRGWSLKEMHRLMLRSSTYRMASRSDPKGEQVDPQNRLLHRMPIRRFEAEAIRDALLAVSGRLDRQLYGPGVLPHLTSFMEGRGRPRSSGPLDGGGRRGIYLEVRRNFLNPMFLAFDYPIPFTTIGRRSVSNVPAQALTLMNDPFAIQQARTWAERVLADPDGSAAERITDLYRTAYGRPPTVAERDDALAFLEQQGRRYESTGDDSRAWADLCHVLINVKEFIFID